MIKYRVYTNNGFVEFTNLQQATDFHLENGIANIETIEFSLSNWNKDTYSSELNDAHNALFTQYYTEREYVNIGEISMWVNDVEYGQEAQSLIDWWKITSKDLLNYLKTVSEETAIDVETYISNLPQLTY